MGRPTCVAAGLVAGAAVTLWAQRRVKRTVTEAVERLTPEHMAGEARASMRAFADRLRDALEEGRHARVRREAELWRDLEVPRGEGLTRR
jgi:hypothetical protein